LIVLSWLSLYTLFYVVAGTRENGKRCGLNRKHACQGGHVFGYSRRISVIE
jgi:hypothetical protein